MGVHHYKVTLVPRAYFGKQLPATLSEEELDLGEDVASGWWACHPPSEGLLAAIRALLPTNKSWGETEEYVSTGDWCSDLRIWKDTGRVWSIAFRFSPVSDPLSILQQFLSIARGEECLLLEELTVIDPIEEVVLRRLEVSRAMRFAGDPTGVIVEAAMELTKLKFVCPSCGYPELNSPPFERMGPPPWLDHGSPPYSLRYGTPSFDVCDCCGFEFGNDDEPGTTSPVTFAQYLRDWIARGCVWFRPSRKPEGWNLEEQLRRASIRRDERVA